MDYGVWIQDTLATPSHTWKVGYYLVHHITGTDPKTSNKVSAGTEEHNIYQDWRRSDSTLFNVDVCEATWLRCTRSSEAMKTSITDSSLHWRPLTTTSEVTAYVCTSLEATYIYESDRSSSVSDQLWTQRAERWPCTLTLSTYTDLCTKQITYLTNYFHDFFFSNNAHSSELSNVVHGRCAWSAGNKR